MTNTPSCGLLPCPFCGGNYIADHPKMKQSLPATSRPILEELTRGGWRVNCYGCGIGTWDNLGASKDEAVAIWNTRRAAGEMPGALMEALEEIANDSVVCASDCDGEYDCRCVANRARAAVESLYPRTGQEEK